MDLIKNKITFLLPLKGDKDMLRAKNRLLKSIDKFFLMSDIEEIIIIYCGAFPPVTISMNISRGLIAKIRYVSENFYEYGNIHGWYKQQIIKLISSELIKTEIYCTLDADIYLLKKCSLEDWYIDGKCKYVPEHMKVHEYWWKQSAKALNFELNELEMACSVTPMLLYTDIVKKLLKYMNGNNINLSETVVNGATEYSLYWLYLINNYDILTIYSDEHPLLYNVHECIWERVTLILLLRKWKFSSKIKPVFIFH